MKRIYIILGLCFLLPLGTSSEAGAQTGNVLRSNHEDYYEFEMGDGQTFLRAERRHHPAMSEEEKERIKKRYDYFRSMPFEKRELLKKRWKKFKSMSPEEQERILKRRERFKNMTPEERKKLRERYQRWKDLPLEHRQRLRRRREMLRKMPPEERQQWRQQFQQKMFVEAQRRKAAGKDKEKEGALDFRGHASNMMDR